MPKILIVSQMYGKFYACRLALFNIVKNARWLNLKIEIKINSKENLSTTKLLKTTLQQSTIVS